MGCLDLALVHWVGFLLALVSGTILLAYVGLSFHQLLAPSLVMSGWLPWVKSMPVLCPAGPVASCLVNQVEVPGAPVLYCLVIGGNQLITLIVCQWEGSQIQLVGPERM